MMKPMINPRRVRLHLVREQNDRPFSARMLPDGTAMHESRRALVGRSNAYDHRPCGRRHLDEWI